MLLPERTALETFKKKRLRKQQENVCAEAKRRERDIEIPKRHRK